MATSACDQPALNDRSASLRVQKVFSRSSALRDAVIAEPAVDGRGAVTIDVGFARYPSVFRVVAPTPEEAYALLYELAASLADTGCHPIGAHGERRGGWPDPVEIHAVSV